VTGAVEIRVTESDRSFEDKKLDREIFGEDNEVTFVIYCCLDRRADLVAKRLESLNRPLLAHRTADKA